MKKNTEWTPFTFLLSSTGGIPFRILLVVLTLLIVGGSLYVLLEKQKEESAIDHRKATELSDYGLQQFMEQILEKLQANKSIEGIKKTDYNGGWYRVTVTASRSDSVLTLAIESEGCSGKQTVARNEKITLYRSVVDGDSLWIPQALR